MRFWFFHEKIIFWHKLFSDLNLAMKCFTQIFVHVLQKVLIDCYDCCDKLNCWGPSHTCLLQFVSHGNEHFFTLTAKKEEYVQTSGTWFSDFWAWILLPLSQFSLSCFLSQSILRFFDFWRLQNGNKLEKFGYQILRFYLRVFVVLNIRKMIITGLD